MTRNRHKIQVAPPTPVQPVSSSQSPEQTPVANPLNTGSSLNGLDKLSERITALERRWRDITIAATSVGLCLTAFLGYTWLTLPGAIRDTVKKAAETQTIQKAEELASGASKEAKKSADSAALHLTDLIDVLGRGKAQLRDLEVLVDQADATAGKLRGVDWEDGKDVLSPNRLVLLEGGKGEMVADRGERIPYVTATQKVKYSKPFGSPPFVTVDRTRTLRRGQLPPDFVFWDLGIAEVTADHFVVSIRTTHPAAVEGLEIRWGAIGYRKLTNSDTQAHQSHALEPAAGLDSNGKSSPPAQ